MAWCALMNSKTRPGSRRSRVRTRLLLERGCRAPAAAVCSRAAAGRVPHAQPRKARCPSPPGGPLAGRLAPPSGRSTARSVRTPGQARPDLGRRGPARPSDGETRVRMADVSWASVKPPLKSLKGSTKPGQLHRRIRREELDGFVEGLFGIAQSL